MDTSAWFQNVPNIEPEAGIRIVGAIALWIIGCWLARFAARLLSRMMQRDSALPILCLLLSSSAVAQTFDNTGNGMLKGDYFVRQVLLANVSAQGVGQAQSLVGTMTFDGNGNYSFTGQLMNSQTGQPQSYSISARYAVGANCLLKLQNPIDSKDTDSGAVGALGPNAFVASATEGSYHDILVGIPAGSKASNSSLQGSFYAAFLDFTGASSSQVRDGYFALNSNGQGSLGDLTINGSAADQNSATTQTATHVTYTLSANGSGTVNFGSASSLINGSKNLYVSQDGNILLGGSPGGFEILVGVRAITPPATSSNFRGTYFLAGLDEDASQLSNGTISIDSFYGSNDAKGEGTVIRHFRLSQVSYSPYDFTFDTAFSFEPDGTQQKDFFQNMLGINGQALLSVGRQDEYSLRVGFQAPFSAGSDVFLNPMGIVNSANFAPITNPVAPGEFVTLFGMNLAPAALQAQSLPLSTDLGGVQVSVNNRPAPIYFVSPTQINIILPYATKESYATFQVTNNGTASNQVTVYARPTSPGIFTLSEDGVGSAAVLHSDYSVVSQDNPAKIGETLQMFMTGLGAVNPALADGAAAPSSPLSTVNVGASVWVDKVSAQVTYKGLAPGYVSLYQVNFVVPSRISSGLVYLEVTTTGAYTSEAKIYVQ